MADASNGGGGGNVVDHPEDEGGPMEVEIENQPTTEETTGVGAAVTGDGGVGTDEVQGVEDEPVRRALVENQRTSRILREQRGLLFNPWTHV